MRKEADEAPAPPAPEPLPDSTERWRLRVQIAGVVLRAHPEGAGWYGVHLHANGEHFESRACKYAPLPRALAALRPPVAL